MNKDARYSYVVKHKIKSLIKDLKLLKKDEVNKNLILVRLKDILKTTDSCLCPYCGEPSGSIDPDVLCAECHLCFGHAFYHEL